MANNETFIYNTSPIATVEKYDIREVAKSFMMYTIYKYYQCTGIITFQSNPLLDYGQ